MIIYIDDMITAGNDNKKIEEVILHFNSVFAMKYLDEPDNFLGMQIDRNRKNKLMTVSQPAYFEKNLEKFNMNRCNVQYTSMITR